MNEDKIKSLLCQLVENQYQAKVQRCTVVGEGGAGKVYKVNIDKEPFVICLKMYKTASLNEQQAYEMEYLNQFSTIKFPKVYFVHNATPDIPINVLGMEFINGRSAFNNKFYWRSQKKRKHCANLAVDSLIKIHNEKNTKFGDLKNPSYTSWNEYYYELSTQILDKARNNA